MRPKMMQLRVTKTTPHCAIHHPHFRSNQRARQCSRHNALRPFSPLQSKLVPPESDLPLPLPLPTARRMPKPLPAEVWFRPRSILLRALRTSSIMQVSRLLSPSNPRPPRPCHRHRFNPRLDDRASDRHFRRAFPTFRPRLRLPMQWAALCRHRRRAIMPTCRPTQFMTVREGWVAFCE